MGELLPKSDEVGWDFNLRYLGRVLIGFVNYGMTSVGLLRSVGRAFHLFATFLDGVPDSNDPKLRPPEIPLAALNHPSFLS